MLLIVLFSPAPTLSLQLDHVPRQRLFVRFFRVPLRSFISLLTQASVFMLRTWPMLLILLNGLLKRLPFFRDNRFERLVLFVIYSVQGVLRNPSVVFLELLKEGLCLFQAVFHRCQTSLRVLAVCQPSNKRRGVNVSVLLHRAFAIRVGVRLLVVIFPVERVQVSSSFLSPSINRWLNFRLFDPLMRFVVVMSMRLRLGQANSLAGVVARPLVLRTMCAPTASARLRNLASGINFRYVERATVLVLFNGVSVSVAPANVMCQNLRLLGFFGLTRVSFRLLSRFIRLLRHATIQGVNVCVRRSFFIPNGVTTIMCLLSGRTRAASRYFISCQLSLLFMDKQSRNFIMPLHNASFALRFVQGRGRQGSRR